MSHHTFAEKTKQREKEVMKIGKSECYFVMPWDCAYMPDFL